MCPSPHRQFLPFRCCWQGCIACIVRSIHTRGTRRGASLSLSRSRVMLSIYIYLSDRREEICRGDRRRGKEGTSTVLYPFCSALSCPLSRCDATPAQAVAYARFDPIVLSLDLAAGSERGQQQPKGSPKDGQERQDGELYLQLCLVVEVGARCLLYAHVCSINLHRQQQASHMRTGWQ